MARPTRLQIPELPHLLCLRGNNAQACFLQDAHYEAFLQSMRLGLAQGGVSLHSFCLLPHAIYLLATPHEPLALSLWIQGVARRFVRLVNHGTGRSGTLFEGRFRSAPLESRAEFFLPCMVAMDYLPLQLGAAGPPTQFSYSSCAHYAGVGNKNAFFEVLRPHPTVWALGNTPFEREAGYNKLLQNLRPNAQTDSPLLHQLLAGWPVGSPAFLDGLAIEQGRAMRPARAGRPRKVPIKPAP